MILSTQNHFGPDYESLDDSVTVEHAKYCMAPLCNGQQSFTNTKWDSLPAWIICVFLVVNKTWMNASCHARSAAICVEPQLPMKAAECGCLFRYCLNLGKVTRCRIHLNQHVIYSMISEWLTFTTICPSGPDTRTVPPDCDRTLFIVNSKLSKKHNGRPFPGGHFHYG